MLDPHPGTPDTAGRACRQAHPPGQDLLGEDQHPGESAPAVRGRDAAELTALADLLAAHGLVLEMLAGPLAGIYDPTGHGRLLFAFFAAMAETERENIREPTLEGLDTAARKGKHGGRPPVITDDMLHTVLRRRSGGETVEQIQPGLIIPTGKRKGQNPSLSSVYRALAEHERRTAYRGRRDGAREPRVRTRASRSPTLHDACSGSAS